ncbi:MAG: hypothetical protein Q4B42_00125 [Oscillospiraceae bacterium]|nr:hypothetical protein [Oscillospiraceae bacterium]
MTEKDYFEPEELPDFTEAAGPRGHAPLFDISADVNALLGEEEPHEQKRRAHMDFLKGFFATLAITIPLCLGTLIVGYDLTGSFGGAEEVSQSAEKVPISVSGGYTLLAAVEEEGRALGLCLLRADADERRLIFTDIPRETTLLDGGRPYGAEDIFAAKGLFGLEAALRETLEVNIDGSLCLSAGLLSELADSLGEFRFSLDRDFEVYGASGIVEYSKHRGTSSFCGNDLRQLLLNAPHKGEERTELFERLFAAAWEEYRSKELAEELSDFYTENLVSLTTDINGGGLYALNRTLEAAAASGEGGYLALRLEGLYLEDTSYMLSENSAQALWACYPKNASGAA